ncbi:MAG: hypothetical protein KA313_03470 [Pseudarcicella sp.]|jgi:hypothetical protein|nr:hypothetical protein [Pseudarcicella sp.]
MFLNTHHSGLLILVLGCFLTGCKDKTDLKPLAETLASLNPADSISIVYINSTNRMFKNVVVDDKSIADLAPGEHSAPNYYSHFTLDSGYPLSRVYAVSNGDSLSSYSEMMWWCGSQWSSLKAGKYTIEMTVDERYDKNRILLNLQ